MSPPSAIAAETNGSQPSNDVPHEPGISKQKAARKMPNFPGPPTFTDKYKERDYLKGRLTAAFRIFGKLGFEEGVAGHITVRDPVHPNCFWVNPFGVAFRMMKRSDLILVNEQGDVVEGGEVRLLNSAAYAIHKAVHEARPDVICAAHSHSIYGRSFCTLGKLLDITTQDSCTFYNASSYCNGDMNNSDDS